MEQTSARTLLPPAWPTVSVLLAGVVPPSAPASSDAGWDARYSVLAVYRLPSSAWTCSPMGALRLRREPTRDGAFQLAVDMSIALPGGQTDRAEALLTCREDHHGSLVTWHRRSLLLSTESAIPETPVRADTGEVRGQRIVRAPGATIRVPPPLVANWTLFDTVRRVRDPLSFAMLEEVDALRIRQMLRPHAEAIAQTASGPVRLRGLLQTGDGALPTTWWIHETGLPLLVLAGLRAYAYNPDATLPEMPR